MKHVISALVENQPGVLARIAGLFSGRDFNIDSLAVGETEDPELSRMTIVAEGDESVLEQIIKQLRRLINVIKVQDLSSEARVERDLMLLKVSSPPAKRAEICQLVDVFRGNVVDVGLNELVIEISGPEAKLEAILSLLKPYGIKELVRTGRIAIGRSSKRA